MVAPIFACRTICCQACGEKVEDKRSKQCFVAATVLDGFLMITSLVISILGFTSTIAMPIAAASALIGTSVIIILLWIPLAISLWCLKGFNDENERMSRSYQQLNQQNQVESELL